MPFTTVPDKNTGDQFTAPMWSTYIKDNLNYLIGLLNGTGVDNVAVPSSLNIKADAYFSFSKNGSNPIWTTDSGDSLQYDRATNAWWFAVGGAVVLTVEATGKLNGSPFYDSGQQTLANATTASYSHGLAARPRFVFGYYGTVSGTLDQVAQIGSWSTLPMRIFTVTGAGGAIGVRNDTGTTVYLQLYAML